MELGGGAWALEHLPTTTAGFFLDFLLLRRARPNRFPCSGKGRGPVRQGSGGSHMGAAGGPPHDSREATGHVEGGEGLSHGSCAAGVTLVLVQSHENPVSAVRQKTKNKKTSTIDIQIHCTLQTCLVPVHPSKSS